MYDRAKLFAVSVLTFAIASGATLLYSQYLTASHSLQQINGTTGEGYLAFQFILLAAFSAIIIKFGLKKKPNIRSALGFLTGLMVPLSALYLGDGLLLLLGAFGVPTPLSSHNSNYTLLFLPFGLLALSVFLYFTRREKYLNLFTVSVSVYMMTGLATQVVPLYLYILFVGFSVYDYLAVFKTKHMLTLSRISLEGDPLPVLFVSGSIKDLVSRFDSGNSSGRSRKRAGTGAALGAGDVVIPGAFVLSIIPAAMSRGISEQLGLPFAIMFLSFAVGILFAFYVSNRLKKPIPALPPILLCISIGTALAIATTPALLTIL